MSSPSPQHIGPRTEVRRSIPQRRQHHDHRMLQGKQPIIYGDGEQKRCFSFRAGLLSIPSSKWELIPVCLGSDQHWPRGAVTINELAKIWRAPSPFDVDTDLRPGAPQGIARRAAVRGQGPTSSRLPHEVSLADGLRSMIDWIRCARAPSRSITISPSRSILPSSPETGAIGFSDERQPGRWRFPMFCCSSTKSSRMLADSSWRRIGATRSAPSASPTSFRTESLPAARNVIRGLHFQWTVPWKADAGHREKRFSSQSTSGHGSRRSAIVFSEIVSAQKSVSCGRRPGCAGLRVLSRILRR